MGSRIVEDSVPDCDSIAGYLAEVKRKGTTRVYRQYWPNELELCTTAKY